MMSASSRRNRHTLHGNEGILPSSRAGSPRSGWLALVLFFLLPCAAPSAQAASALAELIASFEASERFEPDKLAAVYRETVLTGAGVDRAVARLHAYARAVTLSPEGQAACHLAIAHLQWRDGAIDDAIVSSERALESSPTPEALLLKARLLDAGGDEDAAREWYQRAAEAYDEGDEQWLIRVRLAMMDVSSYNVEALEELAKQRDQTFRNQAAVVLALLGRLDRSIELYQPLPEAGRLYRQHLRLSEWALTAESHVLAREQAWLAYERAPVRADRLYALSLLAESYRSADELPLLLEDLAGRYAGDPDLLRLRLETLIETEEYHQAIELYEQLEGSEADIAERRRLVALYEAAGDTDAMVREYRRMMKEEPDQAQWYDGLAAHYLNMADNAAALGVWETLEERNAERAGVLVEGAQLMLQMGFINESVAMVERHIKAHGPDVSALFFLFETWMDRGEDEAALDALQRLEAYLPADAAERVELADAYEQLSRPEEALKVFEAIREVRGELGYDDRMRLAWLYTLVDRKREALDLWRDIWVAVESPARRSLAESQLLLLAAELGALGDMAVELKGMLMQGTANRYHMNLLVRIYAESGDKLSATEIIDEYAEAMGEDEVGHQQLLAQVYILLEDYPAHDKALRRLYEIDPVNRSDHIKSIIINLLTDDLATETNERFEEIERWIGELRKFDKESVTGEFEASVYLAAGFAEQAVEAYRRALVEQPENSDNLLVLADVMDNNGRTDEALAILRFFAENAVEDNDFVVAVDGILNLIGTHTFSQSPGEGVLDVLAWTKRVILERIAGRTNRFYLYELLANIAREQGDTEASFVALENSLAEAGSRRPAVLRELLTMATPNSGFGGFNTGGGDIERQLRYGRRLVGLRQQLPPEVYIGIGKSLLAMEDVSGAERVFEMIDDITGMIDIDRTKAEIFEEAGYDEQSRVFYNRALNVNRDSLDLLHKTGFLFEVNGREDVAFRRYMQAIGDVLRRQSTVLAAGARPVDPNSTVSREFRKHYASLEQGLLLSWPKDAEASEAAAAELKALFETELRNVLDRSDEELLPLARYARLDRSARLIRKAGFFLDDKDLAQYADRRLLDHFGDDTDFAEHLVQAYGEAGRPLPDGVSLDDEERALAALSPLRRQLKLAEQREDFETQLQLLRLDGATDEMETQLGERILDGKFREGLGYALGLLGKAEFRRLALATSSQLLEDREGLAALVGSDVSLLLEAEEVAGQPLVPAQQIIDLLTSPEANVLLSGGQVDRSGLWEFLKARGKVDDRVRYFSENRLEIDFFHELLRENLTEAQADEIANKVIAHLASMHAVLNSGVKRDVFRFLPLNARPENVKVLYRLAEFAEKQWPELNGTTQLIEATYEDRLDEAFWRLVELGGDLLEDRTQRGDFFPGFREILAGPRLRILEELATGQYVDPKLANAAYEIEFLPLRRRPATQSEFERQINTLESQRQLEPENVLHRVKLIELLLSRELLNRAGTAIATEYRISPDEASWRKTYFLLLTAQERFQEALEVATHGGRDAGRRRFVLQLMSGRAYAAGPFAGLFRYLLPFTQRRPTGGTTRHPMRRLNDALVAGDHEAGRLALREVWRRLTMPSSSPNAPGRGSRPIPDLARRLLQTYYAPAARSDPSWTNPRLLLDVVAESPYGADELEQYVRAIPDKTRKGFHQLYRYLAKSLGGGPRQQELRLRLLEQDISDHEFTLWMLLHDRGRAGFAAGEMEAFENRLAAMSDPAPFQLLLAARVYASAGAFEQAAEYYKLVAARRIRHHEFASREIVIRGNRAGDSGVANLLELVSEIAARLPEHVAQGLLEGILSIARRADRLPGADAYFDTLVIASLGELYSPEELLQHAERNYPGILRTPNEANRAGAAKTVELARAYARYGDMDRAVELLRGLQIQTTPKLDAAYDSLEETAMRNTTGLYGIPIPLRTGSRGRFDEPSLGLLEVLGWRERLFPMEPDDWPEVEQWIGVFTDALVNWLVNGEADRAATLQILAALGERWIRAGERELAVQLLKRTSQSLSSGAQPLDAEEASVLIRFAYACQSSFSLDLVAGALKEGQLPSPYELPLVSIFQNSDERTRIQELVREIGMDRGLAMIRLLHGMAERSGESEYAQELWRRIEREEAAERDLRVLFP